MRSDDVRFDDGSEDGGNAFLRELLVRLRAGEISPDDVLSEIESSSIVHGMVQGTVRGLVRPVASSGIEVARLDLERERRTGVPEIVFGEGKAREDLVAIVGSLLESAGRVLVTRIASDVGRDLEASFPGGSYDARARLFRVGRFEPASGAAPRTAGSVAILAAGTSDLAVAEEAALSLEWLGSEVERVYDVGVAALHRVLGELETIRRSSVVLVVAGMDGALPSVVAGLVAVPVIAVPTSIGYGAGFEGLAALLAMLSSCSPGVTVVNIDNGLGAAVAAQRMLGCEPR